MLFKKNRILPPGRFTPCGCFYPVLHRRMKYQAIRTGYYGQATNSAKPARPRRALAGLPDSNSPQFIFPVSHVNFDGFAPQGHFLRGVKSPPASHPKSTSSLRSGRCENLIHYGFIKPSRTIAYYVKHEDSFLLHRPRQGTAPATQRDFTCPRAITSIRARHKYFSSGALPECQSSRATLPRP